MSVCGSYKLREGRREEKKRREACAAVVCTGVLSLMTRGPMRGGAAYKIDPRFARGLERIFFFVVATLCYGLEDECGTRVQVAFCARTRGFREENGCSVVTGIWKIDAQCV